MADPIPSGTSPPAVSDDHRAPVIFFDNALTFGHYNGTAHITLSVNLSRSGGGSGITNTEQVAAYLRMNLQALKQLKEAIAGIELLLEPVKGKSQ